MAYDQNSIPKDLRPLNIMRAVPEEARISPATSSGRPVEGYYASPPTEGSPGTMPRVYYHPPKIQEPGYVFNNAVTGVAGWVQQIVPPCQVQKGVVSGASVMNQGGVYTTSSSYGDHTSDEGTDDQCVSGRKVKFLCSFGGKILPRLSDGALRYVGGQTRIISIGTDVSYGDFVQKMADTYVHNVVIKYQLPDEDLDALVSVSCADDLENMMDEYEKLIERCSDGFAKLRIFLFSPSDLESGGHIGDLHDGGQKYVEAVNGIGDVFNCIARNESIESTVSTLNSDMSGGNEVVDSLSHCLGEFITLSSSNIIPLDTTNATQTQTQRMVYVDQNPITYADSCAAPSIVKPSFGAAVAEQEIPQGSAVMSYPASSPYIQEPLSTTNYVQPPPQMGFPTQLVGTVRQVFTKQPMTSVHMTMNPSFISMRPNVVPAAAVVQSQQVRVENFPAENMIPQKVVQLSSTQGYNQVSAMAQQGGMYNWQQQMTRSEQVASPEGGLTSFTRTDECQMHQHKGSPSSSNTSDLGSTYSSLQSDGRGHPLMRPVASGTRVEGDAEQVVESCKAEVMIPQGVVSGIQVPYGVCMANSPPSSSQHIALQNLAVQPETCKAPFTNEFAPISIHPNKDITGRDSPEHSPKLSTGSNTDYSTSFAAYDINVRQGDAKLQDDIRLSPSQVLYNNEYNKTIADLTKDDSHDNKVGDEVSSVYSSIESTRAAERILNEWNDSLVWSQPRISGTDKDVIDTLGSQFINHDPHYPPPRPTKIQIKRDNYRDSMLETSSFDDGPNHLSSQLNWDLTPYHDHSLSSKGSIEEQIKREVVQEVVEGFAASMFHTSLHSNTTDISTLPMSGFSPTSQHNRDGQTANEMKSKLSGKLNIESPASSVGRLQIIKNSDLEELRELGSGTFGTVYHGKWRGSDVAIKRINDRCFLGKPSEQERMRDDFWNEAIKLADLHHPNVVAFYGVVVDGPEGSVATVTEYMVNGSLRNALQRNDRILVKRKRLLIGMDVAFGMEYLHGKNIVHFDLKSDNLLVNLRDPHRPICKVGDLGLSKVKCQTLISGGVRGTLPWMAPELLNGSSSLVSEKVDVFSFGIIMWELVTGEEPYADLHYGAIIGGIVSNTLRPPVSGACDPDWRDLMERCWSSEPSERPTFTIIADELRAMANKLKLSSKPQLQHSPNSQPKTT